MATHLPPLAGSSGAGTLGGLRGNGTTGMGGTGRGGALRASQKRSTGRRTHTQSVRLQQHLEEKHQRESDNVLVPPIDETARRNACVQVLKDGYVGAFLQLFELSGADKSGAGQEEQHLKTLQLNLARAESAERQDERATMHDAHLALANHFEQRGDLPVASHFRALCVQDTADMTGDPLAAAEALGSLGLAQEKQGQLSDAHRHFQAMYDVTKQSQLVGPTGTAAACTHLVRVLLARAEEEGANCMEHLQAAQTFAQESALISVVNQVHLRLGRAHEAAGNPTNAIEHLRKYLDNCDADGAVEPADQDRACAVLARCYEAVGDHDTALTYLERLVETSLRSQQLDIAIDAASRLGQAHSAKNEPTRALHWYERAFSVAQTTGQTQVIDAARVTLGLARSKIITADQKRALAAGGRDCSVQMLAWKSRRLNLYGGAQIASLVPLTVEDADVDVETVAQAATPEQTDHNAATVETKGAEASEGIEATQAAATEAENKTAMPTEEPQPTSPASDTVPNSS